MTSHPRNLFRSIAVSLCLLVASSVACLASALPENKPGVGDSAPQFVITDLDGKKVALDEILKSGKVVVLNFWGLRCSACIEEIGYLNPINDKYAAKGVRFLGVNVDGVKPEVMRAQMPALSNKPNYTVIPDPDFKIPDLYNMAAAPLSFVIGKDGIIRYRHEDFKPGDEKEIEDALRKALDGN